MFMYLVSYSTKVHLGLSGHFKNSPFQWEHLNRYYHCSDGWHDVGLLTLLDLTSFKHKHPIHQGKTIDYFTVSIRKTLSSRQKCSLELG